MLQIFLPVFNPDFLRIGFLHLRWYSLAYIFGIGIAIELLQRLDKHHNFTRGYARFYDDFVFYGVISLMVGGRIGYVVFYNLKYFLQNFSEIFAIWHGGMSFHGGLIGIVVGAIFLAKKYKLNLIFLWDLLAYVTPPGLLLGRGANFLNSELYGRPTTLPWGVVFPLVDEQTRHPSQLYEALGEGLLLWFIMYLLVRWKNFSKKGLNTGVFLIFYGLFRILLEFVREPDEQLAGLLPTYITMGQLLSLPLIPIGIWFLLSSTAINKSHTMKNMKEKQKIEKNSI
jgi:phosphatidylglycerol:prolipoprotein diacylglycerol transferase